MTVYITNIFYSCDKSECAGIIILFRIRKIKAKSFFSKKTTVELSPNLQ